MTHPRRWLGALATLSLLLAPLAGSARAAASAAARHHHGGRTGHHGGRTGHHGGRTGHHGRRTRHRRRPRTRATALLGDTAVEPLHYALPAGRSQAFRLRARASGRVGSLRLYVGAASTAQVVMVGLYDNFHSRPGVLLAGGSTKSVRRGAWNTIVLTPAHHVSAGGRYWLTILADGGTVDYRARRHGRCPRAVSLQRDLSTLPATASAVRIRRDAHCPISAYAVEASAGAPDAPVNMGAPVIAASPPASHNPLSPAIPLTPVSPLTTTPKQGGATAEKEGAKPKEEPPSEEPTPSAPANSNPPTVGGSLVEGDVLTGTRGTWSGAPTSYSYRWQDCNTSGASCANITGATASSYTLTESDVSHTLRVVVTATNAGGSTPASSAPSAIVAAYSAESRYPSCTQTIGTTANVAGTVSGAAPGAVICLSSGAYGNLSLNATHSSDVTLQAAPSAHVTAGAVSITGSHLVVRGLWIDGEVALEEGTSFVTIDHDDISNESQGGEGIVFDTSDCTVPGAPTWPECEPHAPISDVTISHDHFHDIGQGGSEDAIHLDNWRNVNVTGNEFDHVIESGNHTDCLQSVYGGENLTFTHNYEHDNDCQGIFIKDGDATNVTVTDNLFLRDHEGTYADFAQLWNIKGLSIQRNTIWDGKGMALVTEDASFTPSATIDHNAISNLSLEPHAGAPYSITEGHDIFGEAPNKMTTGAGDSVNANPQFQNTGGDDYRLASNPGGIGIDWSPAEQQYGPAS